MRLIVLVALALACGSSASVGQERLRIVATTTDLKSLTEEVGGDRIEVVSMVPPATNAEDYQPKPQDAVRLKGAALVVRVGLDYDLWFDRLLTNAGLTQNHVRGLRRGEEGHVDASTGIAVLEIRGIAVGPSDGHAHGSGNPHYWLDPKNAEIITAYILEALARADPPNMAYYEANRVAFLARLERKLAEWTARLAPLQGRPIVAYHNSWAYLARRFRLNIVGFIEPRPGVPASPSHLADLLRLMREQDVRMIVRQVYEPEKDARFLADKTGAAVIQLAGSVGALPAASDYLALFDADVEALLAGQAGQ